MTKIFCMHTIYKATTYQYYQVENNINAINRHTCIASCRLFYIIKIDDKYHGLADLYMCIYCMGVVSDFGIFF